MMSFFYSLWSSFLTLFDFCQNTDSLVTETMVIIPNAEVITETNVSTIVEPVNVEEVDEDEDEDEGDEGDYRILIVRSKTSAGKRKSNYLEKKYNLKKNFGGRGNWEDIVESKAGERKAHLKERRKTFKPKIDNYRKLRTERRTLLEKPDLTVEERFRKIYLSGIFDEEILARKAKISKEMEKNKEKLCPNDRNDPEVLAIESLFLEYKKDYLKKKKRKNSKESRFKPNPKDVFFQESEAENFLFEIVEQEIWEELEKKISARADEIFEEMKTKNKFCLCGCNFPGQLAEEEFGICTL